MIRHWTFVENLPSIVANGLLPEGGKVIARKGDRGQISFEEDPPSNWLGEHLDVIKDKPGKEVIALDFDDELLEADGIVIERAQHTRVMANDLILTGFFSDADEVYKHVGRTVKTQCGSGPVSMRYLTSSCRASLKELGYDV